MNKKSDLKHVRINLSGERYETVKALFFSFWQMLFTGKTSIRIKTQLPS